jgi:hypothetical protein
MSHIAIFDKSRTQRLVEAHPCASGCRGDCAQGDRECEFERIRPAEAVSEYAGPDEFESADMEVLEWLFKASMKVSALLLLGVFAWQALDSYSAGFLA